MHTVVGAGAVSGSMDASNLLKPALARGQLRCIGATTINEFRKYIEKDKVGVFVCVRGMGEMISRRNVRRNPFRSHDVSLSSFPHRMRNDCPIVIVRTGKALERRFQQVYVGEPSPEDTVSILRGLKPRYELHHGVRIRDEALLAAAKLSSRYLPDRFLPDKGESPEGSPPAPRSPFINPARPSVLTWR
jgi:ATP-dependent Clp protease ATP-binding subunit ClpB